MILYQPAPICKLRAVVDRLCTFDSHGVALKTWWQAYSFSLLQKLVMSRINKTYLIMLGSYRMS